MKMTNEIPLEAEVVEVALLTLEVSSSESYVVAKIAQATRAASDLVVAVLSAMVLRGLVAVEGSLLVLTQRGYEALCELLESEAPTWAL